MFEHNVVLRSESIRGPVWTQPDVPSLVCNVKLISPLAHGDAVLFRARPSSFLVNENTYFLIIPVEMSMSAVHRRRKS